jgi:hypothetical protein
MTTITTRSGKGSALTHTELDNNFTNLNDNKLESIVATTDPTTYYNPSTTGIVWINETTGEAFVCTNNTLNDNVWINIGGGEGDVAIKYSMSGGTEYTDGIYKVHVFTSSGTLNVINTSNNFGCEILLVAGGGGAGGQASSNNRSGGGAGAGGLIHLTNIYPSSGSYSIVIGSGGSAGTGSYYSVGTNGSNSTALGYTAIGGGRGGAAYASRYPGDGGSGGGSGSGGSIYPVGSGTAGQGHDGGLGGTSSYDTGGSGGGAGGPGNDHVNNGGNYASCAGGLGVYKDITGSSVYYAKGGAAVILSTTEEGAGPANTGQGGSSNNGYTGYSGGSGIFVIRYQY